MYSWANLMSSKTCDRDWFGAQWTWQTHQLQVNCGVTSLFPRSSPCRRGIIRLLRKYTFDCLNTTANIPAVGPVTEGVYIISCNVKKCNNNNNNYFTSLWTRLSRYSHKGETYWNNHYGMQRSFKTTNAMRVKFILPPQLLHNITLNVLI